MENEKNKDRKILIRRFFYDAKQLYNLGKAAGIEWFDKFDYKFGKDEYAYFAEEERIEAINKLADPSNLSNEKFVSALNKVGSPKYMAIDRFVSKNYYFDANYGGTFKLEDRRSDIHKDVEGVLKETNDRAYYFFKAIIELYKEGKWDNAYGGATWIDILAKIRELKGEYPAPRDIAILKSYRIYYKTGSRRYPTHTIPEEMLDTMEDELMNLKPNK